MPIRTAILACLLTLCAASAVSAQTLAVRGVVARDVWDDDRIGFELQGMSAKFVLDAKKVPAPDDFYAMLEDSAATGRSVVVHLYLDSGHFEDGDSRPSFAVGGVDYDGKTYAGESAPPPADPKAAPAPGQAAAADLAKGMAYVDADDVQDARAALDRAIAGGALDSALQISALHSRGDLNQRDALSSWPAGADRDKNLMAALNDYEAWKKLDPQSGNVTASIANLKASLGAYDEAIADFRAMLDKWPRNKFWTYISIAATYRTQGEYQKSLGALDELVSKEGPQDGMAYHYHRGWTLSRLGRYDEAIAEFDAGLKGQPDYAYAFLLRACAHGQTGKLSEAVADQEQAAKLLRDADKDGTVLPDAKFNIEHADAVLGQLRAALAKDPHAKLDIACTGYWAGDQEKRARSALFPAAVKP